MIQTADDMTPPAAPPPPAPGFAFAPVRDPAWRVAEPGKGCRWRPGAAPGEVYPSACGKDAVAAAEDPGNALYQWRDYCAEHTLAHLHWIEGGQVMTWELRHDDGSPLTETETELTGLIRRRRTRDWCSQHKRPRAGCPPEARHTYSIRQRGDLMAEVERLTREQGIDLNMFVTRALEDAAGWKPPGNARERSRAGGRALQVTSPPHTRPVAAAAATASREGKNAAREDSGQRAVIAELRKQAPDLVLASDLPRPGTAVFQEPEGGKVVTSPVPEVPRQGRQHAVNCKCGVCKPKAVKQ